MTPVTILMAASSMATCTLVSDDELRLSDHQVRIGDVVELGCIAESQREAVAALELWRASTDERAIDLSRRVLANLAQRRVPALSFFEVDRPYDSIRIRFATSDQGADGASSNAATTEPRRPISFGDGLMLETISGPVRIERHVTAMQGSDGRGEIFVKDADGRIFLWSASALRPSESAP